jgi:hypothetical protein
MLIQHTLLPSLVTSVCYFLYLSPKYMGGKYTLPKYTLPYIRIGISKRQASDIDTHFYVGMWSYIIYGFKYSIAVVFVAINQF